MAIVLLKPNYPPYVCIVCGLGSSKSRKWFVDLQLAIDNYFNPVNDGAVYLCNECWDSLVRDVSHKAYTMMKEEEPWEASLDITYAAEGELLQSRPLASNPSQNQSNVQEGPVGIQQSSGSPVGPEQSQKEINDGPGLSSEGSGELNITITGDDSNTETTDSELDTDITTAEDGAESVREFREFFGKSV